MRPRSQKIVLRTGNHVFQGDSDLRVVGNVLRMDRELHEYPHETMEENGIPDGPLTSIVLQIELMGLLGGWWREQR